MPNEIEIPVAPDPALILAELEELEKRRRELQILHSLAEAQQKDTKKTEARDA